MRALAIDFGGTHATCGLVEDRVILAHKTLETDGARSLHAVLPRVTGVLRELINEQAHRSSDFAGIAVGFAGIVDSRAGRVLSSNEKYPDLKEVDLCAWGREAFNLPLRIENDARVALLGEAYGGAARGFNDVVMMTLGTGIGAAAIIEGRLLRGKHSQAGCLGGHFPVLFTGRPCNCGAIGCAEAEASGWALPKIVQEWPGVTESALSNHASIGFKELFEEAARGDETALAIRNRCLMVWAADAVALVHAYDPEIVVVGGGVMQSAEVIIPFLQSYVREHTWTPWGKVRVRAAELGNNAALLGAIPLLSQPE